jgi:endonuclease/exonuclease/phosphatase (EEP) superfamily protein YafD
MEPAARRPGLRRAAFVSFHSLVLGLSALGLIGFFVRDRSAALAPLLYLSMVPFGLVTVALTIACWRSVRRWIRYLLLGLGLSSTATNGYWMIGHGVRDSLAPKDQRVSILHWNVWWGGTAGQGRPTWKSVADELIERGPDILVLSEAPLLPAFYKRLERLSGRRFPLSLLPGRRRTHFFHVFILSRWPVHLERWVPVEDGAAAIAVVEHPHRPIRMLVVDGMSTFTHLRTPMLRDIARACARAADAGEPIDVLVGDFNAVSRSIGFDDFESAGGGYQLASRACPGWRGTWPAYFPVLDIDHIWARNGWTVLGCRLFTNLASDHRGQVADLLMRDAEPYQ